MKRLLSGLIILVLFVLFSAHSLWGQTPTGWPGCQEDWPSVLLTANDCPSEHWDLVFEDDFLNSALNTDIWIPRTPWGDPSNHSTYNLPGNIVLENGNAQLRVLKEPGNYPVPWCGQDPVLTWYDWTGAEMCTYERFQYGRFEMKCTIPRGVGYWPAFWLYSSTQDHAEEIDIFEFWNEWIFYWFGWIDWYKMSRNQNLSIHHCDWEEASEHLGWEFWNGSWLFSIEWDPFTVKWFVREADSGEEVLIREDYHFYNASDNVPISGCSEIQPGNYYLVNTTFPTIPMGLIASFKMGWNVMGPNNSTPDEGALIIDYIKVFRKRNCDLIIQKCSMGDLAEYPTTVYAKQILLGNNNESCSTDIQGLDFNFKATEKIVLQPYFHVKPALNYQVCGNTTRYSTFTAKVESCDRNKLPEKISSGSISNKQIKTALKSIAGKTVSDSETIYAPKRCELFPNPSHGDITLVFPDQTDIKNIEVFNYLGQLIKEETIPDKVQQIKMNIAGDPGVYVMIIHFNDDSIIRKKALIE
ncbi:MAG: family 16 glycosylhydrolase [Bacteroidales bacterium]|nr:family 16 glycosylhydrolase [Bacteroidales bacterium]